MRQCAQCGEDLTRSHRKLWERPVYAVVFKCRLCEARFGRKQPAFNYWGANAKCPRCGNGELKKRETPDKIDQLIRTPISLLQGIFGASLYHCLFCRIQFYDFRARLKQSPEAPSDTFTPVP